MLVWYNRDMKNAIIALVVLILIGLGFFIYSKGGENVENPEGEIVTNEETPVVEEQDKTKTVIGQSVEGKDIVAYHYVNGSSSTTPDTDVLFIGGIHGGYEWNTALVAYEAMDYFQTNANKIPENVRVTVIPVLNPDGLQKIVGTADKFTKADVPDTDTVPGRFNANGVDLNRNFDCDWEPEGVWQDKKVDAGTRAFSEPESQAMKAYIDANTPDAVVVWYSAAGGVFASNCHNGVLAETKTLTNEFAKASGYRAYEEFNFYEITGDMVNWLAKENIPAISVLLTTHTDTEWTKNQKGIDAILEYYRN